MALAAVDAGQTVMAIQLYSGQVHTNRMDMTPALDFIVAQSAKGKPVVRIEGSASDGPSSRAGGNMELASSRAMDVYLRLVDGLPVAAWKRGAIMKSRLFAGFNPMGTHQRHLSKVRPILQAFSMCAWMWPFADRTFET